MDIAWEKLLPNENDWTCIACGYNVKKWEHKLSKIQRKKNFFTRLKYAEHKKLCICMDAHKIIEGNDFNKTYKILSNLKYKKLKINIILIENLKIWKKYLFLNKASVLKQR